ncbi:hypothetical protein Bca52824_065504 [Brassica carinata]|uniref:N-acetyltransferase domain-containing protein n=1 Tax=Brassica carinata TaxID=52824 RepID=A0A8X7QID7_BRACI|nr:hypothetical protein Bca52824_065504 [Brassica carinata]
METPPSIFLRPFDLSDAEDVLKWAGDDDVTQARQHILQTAIPHPWRRSICLLKDGRSIGCVSVRPHTGDGRCRADLGYAVSRQFWGRGIATAAVRMAVEQAFEIFPEVVRLQAVKAGFEKEGLLKKYGFCKGGIRDMFLYSFVKGP